jgi:hypothetical protein
LLPPSFHLPAHWALTILVLLGGLAGTVASAAPLPCETSCLFTSPCNTACRIGTFNTTCGFYGVCEYIPSGSSCLPDVEEGVGGAGGIVLGECSLGYRQIAIGNAIQNYESRFGPDSWDNSCDQESGPNLCECTTEGNYNYTWWSCTVRARPPKP